MGFHTQCQSGVPCHADSQHTGNAGATLRTVRVCHAWPCVWPPGGRCGGVRARPQGQALTLVKQRPRSNSRSCPRLREKENQAYLDFTANKIYSLGE